MTNIYNSLISRFTAIDKN